MARRPTATSAFGVSRREGHDSTPFYRRFTPPELSADSEVAADRAIDKLIVGDARQMEEVPDSSVALVVTSPPYFAGKEYEEALGEGGVPATYLEYLQFLREVFAQCVRKLEPGGRMAVNVANLGRRPYRSLSADVIGILQDDLGLLMRGEIIWLKQRGSSGSCAWGSFQRAGNPVLRDLTERVLVASKGRFDRAVPPKERERRDLPWQSTMTRDDFMENTLDVWEIPAESATRVGHPAPFPLELPARLIDLYTYRGDLVLDPFLGSGSTALAAARAGRHYVGYDTEESYVRLAEARLRREGGRLEFEGEAIGEVRPIQEQAGAQEREVSRALGEGRGAKEIAALAIGAAGFSDLRKEQRQGAGLSVSFTARDASGVPWLFEVAGGFGAHRSGLRRSEALWKAIAKAAVIGQGNGPPLVLLSTGLPEPRSPGAAALSAVVGKGRPIRAVVDLANPSALAELRALCGGRGRPL